MTTLAVCGPYGGLSAPLTPPARRSTRLPPSSLLQTPLAPAEDQPSVLKRPRLSLNACRPLNKTISHTPWHIADARCLHNDRAIDFLKTDSCGLAGRPDISHSASDAAALIENSGGQRNGGSNDPRIRSATSRLRYDLSHRKTLPALPACSTEDFTLTVRASPLIAPSPDASIVEGDATFTRSHFLGDRQKRRARLTNDVSTSFVNRPIECSPQSAFVPHPEPDTSISCDGEEFVGQDRVLPSKNAHVLVERQRYKDAFGPMDSYESDEPPDDRPAKSDFADERLLLLQPPSCWKKKRERWKSLDMTLPDVQDMSRYIPVCQDPETPRWARSWTELANMHGKAPFP